MKIDLEGERKEILKRYRKLLRDAKKSQENLDKKMIRKAFEVAVDKHKHMRRKSGEPYIYHPIAVAQIVAEEICLGTTSIVCALLHDTVEDTDLTLDDVERMFGPKVRLIIDGLTKIDGVIDHSDPNYSIQGENFKKMMLTLSEDARVILVKLADRLHNMRTMQSMPRQNQVKTSYETLFLYGPLAHRLGLNKIKTELEDLAFRYTEPQLYGEIEKKLNDSKRELTKYINKFTKPIIGVLDETNHKYVIKGRPKSIYSISRKMKTKNIPFEEVYDIFAIRVIIDSDKKSEQVECWSIFSMITNLYKPNPNRLRDWISIPKANGYEALHTTVMGPDGKWVEVQLRSKRMDDIAEKGLAAHWKYKGLDSADSKLDQWITKIRHTLENTQGQTGDFIDDLKMDLFSEEIFVFTPAGDIKTLPKGATALDFAYEVHSKLGDQCIGAKISHNLVSLSHVLNNGDQIEILHSTRQTPKEDWLDIAKTTKSKHIIKSSLKKNKLATIEKGEDLYHKIVAILELQDDSLLLKELVSHYKTGTNKELFYSIALKKIDRHSIKKYLDDRKKHIENEKNNQSADALAKKYKKNVLKLGEENMGVDYTLSTCCNPIPGDEVFGFITNDKGVVVHTTNCRNAMHLQANFAYRSVKAVWEVHEEKEYLTGISFTGTDNKGLLETIVGVISHEEKINMKSLTFDSEDGIFNGQIMLYIQNTNYLDELIKTLFEIQDIRNIKRIHTV
ncbi:MAG: guanosine-3',5'-bis(diphosphate) 3'-pyrophosphohydrolase [Glaciecola sp.]|jgi:guanosine-3',5'-bis(diphosphate) 3'-pyrophosphohydrolase